MKSLLEGTRFHNKKALIRLSFSVSPITTTDNYTMANIVRSLLETDLYKFTMWQALLHSHPNSQAKYSFVCRSTPLYPLADLAEEVNVELDHLCELSFSEDELGYLR